MANERMLRSEIPVSDCYRLLETQSIGRLAILEHGYPVAIPINYRLTGPLASRRIVMRTAPSTTTARHDGRASLEVDHIDEAERTAWSVIARGTLRRLFAEDSCPDPLPWMTDGRDQWLALEVVAVSGRRFVGQTGRDCSVLGWRFE